MSKHIPRAEVMPLSVLADFCELAELGEQDAAHARAFDFMLRSCTNVMAERGTVHQLQSAAVRIATACEIALAHKEREGGANV
jgi:hypothetical protein